MRVILSAGKKVYFTLLASSFMFPISAFAQCVDNKDCVSLGYKETTNNENCLKCPFGEYWFCPGKTAAEEPEEPQTAVLGQCTGYAKNCNIADILYTDGTCSADVVSGKTPIAVVVYISADKTCGQALALENLGGFAWSVSYNNIPASPDYSSAPTKDFNSCQNTQAVITYGYNEQYGEIASEYYPAFWQVYNYAPSTMPKTKGKWCLPAGGVLNSIGLNKMTIDQTLTKINKENIGDQSWWSSSEYDSSDAWEWSAYNGNFTGGSGQYHNKDLEINVRPVIEF